MHAILPREGSGELRSARDEELLRRFVAVRDQAAFEEIVRRHGPLVLGACLRILRHRQDAEDAFQATFLTLASRAKKIKCGGALPSWLHRVATRIARDLQRQNALRQKNMSHQDTPNLQIGAVVASTPDLRVSLDEALDHLPVKYRSAVLLCDYYGYSRKDAAASLKVPIGTLLTNLRRGRELLRKRLAPCGAGLSTAGLVSTLAGAAKAAGPVPAELIHRTSRFSLLFVAGQSAAKPAGATTAFCLARSTIRRMTMMKVLSTSAMCLAVGAIGLAVPEITRTNMVRAQQLFVDDFEDGDISDGTPVAWLPGLLGATAQVTGGDLVLSGGIETLYVEGSEETRNVSLETQFRFLASTGTTRNAYVFARTTGYPGYFAGMRQSGELIIVEGAEGGSTQIVSRLATTMNPFNRDVLLKFDVVGDSLSLTAWHEGEPMPPTPQLTVIDDTLAVGVIGLGIGGSDNGSAQVAFRHFAAVPEPSTAVLSGIGMASLGGFFWLRRHP